MSMGFLSSPVLMQYLYPDHSCNIPSGDWEVHDCQRLSSRYERDIKISRFNIGVVSETVTHTSFSHLFGYP